MPAPVKFARQARKDIREIAAFIARNNPSRALTFSDELLLRAKSLGAHPRIRRVVPGQDDETVREIVHGAYRIVYRLTGDADRIFILRFWHAARGTPQIVED